MSLRELLENALKEREWDQEVIHDDDDNSDYVNVQFTIDNQNYLLQIIADDEMETLRVLLFSNIKIPTGRLKEASQVINWFNYRLNYGNFDLEPDGKVYYRWGLALRDAKPATTQIHILISTAADAFDETHVSAIASCAFTKQSAEDIIKDFEGANETEEESQSPAEL